MGAPKNAMGECLILGQGPLPPDASPPPAPEHLRHTPFATLRLWQGLRALVGANLQCRVLVEEAAAIIPSTSWVPRSLPEGAFLYQACPPGGLEDALLKALRKDSFKAVITLGPFAPARAGALTPPGIPTWIDLPGCLMAEAQLRGDAHFGVYRDILTGALTRGDAFSVCSTPQSHALLGQLGLMGRLSEAAMGWEGVQVIPPGIDPTWCLPAEGPETHPALELTEGQRLILHIGSVNTWSDVKALGDALEFALSGNRHCHFLGVGGAVEGHAHGPARALWDRLEASEFGGRCWNAGWVSPGLLLKLLDRGDVAISLDKPSVEATLGARTRLGIGVARGLPWVLTPLGEGSQALVAQGLAVGVSPGDGKGAGAALLRALEEPLVGDGLRRAHLKGQSPALTMAPLVAWARDPQLAPPSVETEGMGLERGRLEAEAELRRLRSSPTLRVLNWVHRLLPGHETGK